MSKSDDTGSVLFFVFHVIFIVLMFGGFSEYFIEIYVGLWVLAMVIVYFKER
jgi:hypothetical protein